jgi:hypothetical protein
MLSVAVETPLEDDEAWHEPAQSRERTSSPFPPGLAVETVVDSNNMHNKITTFNLIQSLLGMNDNATPVTPTSRRIMLNIIPAVSLGPGFSGTLLEFSSTESFDSSLSH